MTEFIFEKEIQTAIGSRLRQAREQKGLKQEELATLAGTSTSYISDIERGKSLISVKIIIPLKRNFRLNIDWLLDEEGEMFVDALAPKERTQKELELENARLRGQIELLKEMLPEELFRKIDKESAGANVERVLGSASDLPNTKYKKVSSMSEIKKINDNLKRKS